jgi:hypothetical protein
MLQSIQNTGTNNLIEYDLTTTTHSFSITLNTISAITANGASVKIYMPKYVVGDSFTSTSCGASIVCSLTTTSFTLINADSQSSSVDAFPAGSNTITIS